MWLVKGASDFMQRLSGLPPAPNVTLLDRRKPKPFSRPHTTPPLHTRLTSDGVASTYRMHPRYRTCAFYPECHSCGFDDNFQFPGNIRDSRFVLEIAKGMVWNPGEMMVSRRTRTSFVIVAVYFL